MNYEIHITRQPLSDAEFIAAVIAILKVPAPAPISAKVNAICALVPLSGVNKFKALQHGYSDHTPVIIGPEVPGDGFDKEWTLHWRKYPDATPSPV
jgi:hypothetical protein